MEFRTLLTGCGLALEETALCLHKPGDARSRNRLAIMAENEPLLFEAYQAHHHANAEATLKKRTVMASFLSRGDGTMGFVGLYRQTGWITAPPEELDARPEFQALREKSYDAFRFTENAESEHGRVRVLFQLEPMPDLFDLRGRLIVADPGTRTYMRLAETTPLPVLEITRTPDLSPPVPDWRELTLTTAELRALPRRWADTLRHWRGIYLITDERDGQRYVGAAYGEDNLLGRWLAHVSGETGVTNELSRRRTDTFRFSILDLLSPAATPDEVTRSEQNWMIRLHTKQFGLNM